jgi:parallel beta-helix repeat protein
MNMKKKAINVLSGLLLIVLAMSCGRSDPARTAGGDNLQERLILARPGEVIEIAEGTHHFTRPLSLLDVDNVTIRGQGKDRTILSFLGQIEGAEGLFVRANGITIEDLSILDTKGDGIKIQDSDGVTIRRVGVTWSGGPAEENGAYGLYPVSSTNVIVEHSVVSGASDAGIYVGQSVDVVVRHNTVYENVAGIEIENCIQAEVYGNEARNNTGGILVFDLPGLNLKNGHSIRIHDNVVDGNNHPNFAPPGNIVGMVPAGTGVLVMSTDQVDIYNNTITGHRSVNTAIVSYLITELPFSDPEYNPFPSGVRVFGNRYTRGEALPDTTRAMGQLLAGIFGTRVPHIVHDGILNPQLMQGTTPPDPSVRICIGTNEGGNMANLDAPSGFRGVSTDPGPYACPDDVYSTADNR